MRHLRGTTEEFITHFVREQNGAWRCVSFAELPTDLGRIQVTAGTRFMPGTIFMGVDIVKCLDEELDRLSPRRASTISISQRATAL